MRWIGTAKMRDESGVRSNEDLKGGYEVDQSGENEEKGGLVW